MASVKIKLCVTCKPHPFQDKRYGKNRRVFNRRCNKGGNDEARCTVCSKSISWK